MTRVLGLNLTQDASVCVLVDDLPICLAKERITRQKHHWGELGDLDLYLERIPEIKEGVDLVVECYSSDPEVQHRSLYHKLLQERLGDVEIIEISHHLSHASSAFYPSGFDSAAVIVIDAQGSPVNKTEAYPAQHSADPQDLEIASFYHAQGTQLTCLHKQTMPGWTQLSQVEPAGLGWFYLLLTQCIFPGEGNEGKVMGLAPYGNPNAAQERLGLTPLEIDGPNVKIPECWMRVLKDQSSFLFQPSDVAPEAFFHAADLAAAGQQAFEDGLLQLANWLHRETGAKQLCYAGGAALNCSANGRLLREGPFEEIFIPPAPHDGGTALGNALYGSIVHRGHPRRFHWSHDYLGPQHEIWSYEVLQNHIAQLQGSKSALEIDQPSELAASVAKCLASGQVVALYQGQSESGPRALGNRSILADPRDVATRDWINDAIKGRERFRPLAPLVLQQKQLHWFEIGCDLPFMQFAVSVRADQREQIPAVTHVDGSARIQTVTSRHNPLVHDILMFFERETQVPVLINTSLNGQNEPMVETLEDVLQLFVNTPLNVLVVPPFVIYKRE